MLRGTAAIWTVGLGLMSACGGPPIGSKIPQADPAAVAVGAAAAATALTLANPNAPARKPEKDPGKAMQGVKSSKETVPEGVLDRSEAGDPGADEPCTPEPAAGDAGAASGSAAEPTIDVTTGSTPDPDRIATPPPPPKKRCKETKDGK